MTPTIVANWKMQLGVAASVDAATRLRATLDRDPIDATIVVCPSFLAIPYVLDPLSGSDIKLGAQDVFWTDKGAHTGEVSPTNLREVGVEYVIIGHSERRKLGETDTDVGRKTLAAAAYGLKPIICVGETSDERATGQHEHVVRRQVEGMFLSAPPPSQGMVIHLAYEPMWAIGTGEPADPATAEAIRQCIYRSLIDRYPAELVARSFRILYGGSVDPTNVTNYVGPGKFDGALVGGASLNPDTFVPLIRSCLPTTTS